MSGDEDAGADADLRARVERRVATLSDALADLRFDGRGIVVAAGGVRLFVNVYVLARVLRRQLNCTTPIEVWHFGETELSPRMRSLLADLDVTTVDAAPIAARLGVSIQDGWQLKPFALLLSRFAETLMLDADQVPVVDPSVAFDWPQFRETGALFWPDIVDLKGDNPIWMALGLPAERRVSLESGQLLVDKRRHRRASIFTMALNEMAESTYRYVYGDKDTFLLGWMLTQSSFVVVPHRPFIEERSLTQRDFDGAPFLQHRTGAKWSYMEPQYHFDGAVHKEACAEALAALRAAWSGRIFLAPPRDLRARAAESALVAAKRLRFEIEGEEGFDLEFLSDGEIGMGRTAHRANWSIVDTPTHPSGLALQIEDRNGGLTFELSPQSDGDWAGERRRAPRVQVLATAPSASSEIEPVAGSRRGLVDDLIAAADLTEPEAKDEACLCAALLLLSRLEPEIADRLRWLAEASQTPRPLAARLAKLAGAVEAARKPDLRDVRRHEGVLGKYYVKVPDPAVDWQT